MHTYINTTVHHAHYCPCTLVPMLARVIIHASRVTWASGRGQDLRAALAAAYGKTKGSPPFPTTAPPTCPWPWSTGKESVYVFVLYSNACELTYRLAEASWIMNVCMCRRMHVCVKCEMGWAAYSAFNFHCFACVSFAHCSRHSPITYYRVAFEL